MLAGKMYSSLARECYRKVIKPYKRPRAARPLILRPTLRRAALETLAQTPKHVVQLLQRRGHTLVLFKFRDSLGFARSRVGHQDPAWSRLAPRRLPDLDRVARKREAVQSLTFPNAITSLQVNSCNCIVASFLNQIAFLRRQR